MNTPLVPATTYVFSCKSGDIITFLIEGVMWEDILETLETDIVFDGDFADANPGDYMRLTNVLDANGLDRSGDYEVIALQGNANGLKRISAIPAPYTQCLTEAA